MATAPAYADLDDFIADRASWLRVVAVENEHGSFDVVLRIDGSYAVKESAEEMADYFRKHLAPVLKAMDLERVMTDWNA
ncbi:MAG: hypothetical protein WBP93_16820 [Pyrinomonadaceae bacterium]